MEIMKYRHADDILLSYDEGRVVRTYSTIPPTYTTRS